jgi:hypothetical protein
MKEKQVREELGGIRWPAQKISLLKTKWLTSVLIG